MSPPEAMLARAVDELPRPDALPGGNHYEPKWDGFRLLADVGASVTLWSRNGADLTSRFPDVAVALGEQTRDVVFDGEVVIWRDDRLDFTALQERMTAGGKAVTDRAQAHPAHYVIFDVLSIGGLDARHLGYLDRRQLLEAMPLRPPLMCTPSTTDVDEAVGWMERFAVTGMEGLVIKGADQPYAGGDRGWLKYRQRRTTEALVGAVDGTLDAPGRLVLGAWTADGGLQVLGATSPLSIAAADRVSPHLTPADATHPWPTRLPGHLLGGLAGQRGPADLLRVTPTTVVEVAVDTAFERGRWRHPVRFHRIRTDVGPASVTVDHVQR